MPERQERRVPSVIGDRYRIISEIGNGTYGTVYLGIDNKTGQKVAIKYMTSAAKSLEQLLNLREVRSLRKMNDSPCIVQLLDAIYINEVGSFLVFELLDCDLLAFLRQYQQNKAHVPEEVVARIMYRVFCALARVHNSGYFHRDLKPENILINQKEGSAKLCDFGLVRDMHATSPLTPYIATRWYRSPEMLLEANDYGPPVDMWAAGCIMIEVLQSRPIFEGKDNSETFQQIIERLGGFEQPYIGGRGGGDWPQGMNKLYKHGKFARIYEQSALRFSETSMRGLSDHIRRPLSVEAVSLISRLLTFDPAKRLTAAQALAHPFCAKARASEPHCAPLPRPIPRILPSIISPSQPSVSASYVQPMLVPNTLRHHIVGQSSMTSLPNAASTSSNGLNAISTRSTFQAGLGIVQNNNNNLISSSFSNHANAIGSTARIAPRLLPPVSSAAPTPPLRPTQSFRTAIPSFSMHAGTASSSQVNKSSQNLVNGGHMDTGSLPTTSAPILIPSASYNMKYHQQSQKNLLSSANYNQHVSSQQQQQQHPWMYRHREDEELDNMLGYQTPQQKQINVHQPLTHFYD